MNETVLRNAVRKIVAEARDAATNDAANRVVYDTIKGFEASARTKLTNRQRDKITSFLYDFIYTDIFTDVNEAKMKKQPPYKWVCARDLKPGDIIDVYAGTDKGQERGSRIINIDTVSNDEVGIVTINRRGYDEQNLLDDDMKDILLITDLAAFKRLNK